MPSGNLFYVIGPSGAGKDTLMNYAREKMNGRAAIRGLSADGDPAAVRPVLFAHRYITRPAEAGGENHVCLSPTEFAQRKALGFFALDWQSHGNGYGIGTEIRSWLGGGAHVVVNGSREYLAAADERFPDLRVVLISVSPEVLRQRLVARGRETAGEIERRIDRSRQIAQVHHPRLLRLDNDAPLEESGARFIELLAG